MILYKGTRTDLIQSPNPAVLQRPTELVVSQGSYINGGPSWTMCKRRSKSVPRGGHKVSHPGLPKPQYKEAGTARHRPLVSLKHRYPPTPPCLSSGRASTDRWRVTHRRWGYSPSWPCDQTASESPAPAQAAPPAGHTGCECTAPMSSWASSSRLTP